MRIPVRLDGTAALSTGKIGNLDFDLPEVALAGTPALPNSAVPSTALWLRSTGNAAPFHYNIELGRGENRLPLPLEIRAGEEYLEGGWVAEVGPESGIWVFTWPFSESVRERLLAARPSLAIWANARHLFRTSERFVQAGLDVRSTIGPSAILWAPRIALPENLAFLHLLGIDLVDSTEGMFRASRGTWLFPDFESSGPMPPQPRLCQCQSCTNPPSGTTTEHSRAVGNGAHAVHAVYQYAQEECRIRYAVLTGRLRELVESRIISHPYLGEALRWFDRYGGEMSEAHAAVTGDGIRPYVIAESHRRPELRYFRRRFLERYTPPTSKRTLVLVPCSYTKPYRNSPTHRSYARALGAASSPQGIHIVSVTSPLGVVPSELEDFYPARNYDIPVTGDWSELEREWVLQGIRRLLKVGKYERIAVHLPQDEYGWVAAAIPPSDHCTWTVKGSSGTSAESLEELSRFASSLPGGMYAGLPAQLAEAKAEIGFQFSPGVAERFFSANLKLRGLPWSWRLTEEGGDILATWKETRGTWHLTTKGAEKIQDVAGDFCVQVNEDVELRGDLFAPGAASAGSEVRVGSEVILVSKGRVIGVGEAEVPGVWMGRLRKGLVVRVRKHGQKV